MSVQSKSVSQAVVGESEAIDIFETKEIRVSYGVTVTGSVVYTVQHSLNGITFYDNTDNTAQTTSRDGNYIFPVRSVRVNLVSGTGSVVLDIRQAIT